MNKYTLAWMLIILAVFLASSGYADEAVEVDYPPAIVDGTEPYPVPAGDRYAKRCSPTPSLSRMSYPGSNRIPNSSKIARPAGKSQFTDGQIIYLRGRVFDVACVPLRDAKVEIWHRDVQGNYILADERDLATPYPLFAGAGRTVTDNRGEFLFETIYPGAIKDSAPYINIRVSHPALGSPVTSTIYFAGEPRNANDRTYSRLSQAVKDAVTAPVVPFNAKDINSGLLVHHDIILRARDRFRGF